MADEPQTRQALFSRLLEDVAPYLDCEEAARDKGNPAADAKAVACDILVKSLFKKWQCEGSEPAETRALLTFLEANHLSRGWDIPSSLQFNGELAIVWGAFRRELEDFFHNGPDLLISSEIDIFEAGKVGPGAALMARSTSFYGKMGASPLTATSIGLYDLYRRFVERDPRWAEMEDIRNARYGNLHIVSGSNVSFAPKNVDTARLICTEPSVNMWAQLGLCQVLETRMKEKWNLSLDEQPEINRLMARKGSLDGSLATLDLSSASDSVSVALCKRALPEWFYELLMDLRSPSANATKYGLNVELGMISTMGNGFTFPLMTIILSCAVRACYAALSLPIQDNARTSKAGYIVPGNWAVFGDDLIVRNDAYDLVVSFIQSLGFRVNDSKSFNKGPFRESCGHDYFNGHNVRGVYLKRLTSRQDITVAVNRLNDWTYRTGVPLRGAVAYLVSLIAKPLYVPYAETDDAGIKVPSSIFRGVVRRKPHLRFKACYERSVARSNKVRIGDGVVITPNGSKRMMYNGAAALLSFLLGELRDGSLIIRQNQSGGLYQTRWQVTPNWDYMPLSLWVNPHEDWPRWKAAVEDNLTEVLDPRA